MILKDLQTLPILYLSRYINKSKSQYYILLNEVRAKGTWEDWNLYMLDGVEQTAKQTIWIIKKIKQLMQDCKALLKAEHPKIYSHELLNNLFSNPYTKIELIQNDLGVSRITAAKYLNQLSMSKIVEKNRIGKNNYYINQPLYNLFLSISDKPI